MTADLTFDKSPNWINVVNLSCPRQSLDKIRQERHQNAVSKLEEDQKAAFEQLKHLVPSVKTFSNAVVQIGCKEDINADEALRLDQGLKAFIPWKKGPFNFFGTTIDAEWRSDLKWDRFSSCLSSMKDHVVADIGCNNGYFMFRMLEHDPLQVIGFEPVAKHWLSFHLFNAWAKESRLAFETLGIEHMGLFPDSFDSIFCLGILYHHTDPIGLLRSMKKALKKGGQLLIDCQGIPGDEDIALMPKNRYTGARGFWLLPTLNCLKNMISRAGFSQTELIFAEKLSPDEQRSTDWAPIKSLCDFLDPENPEKTIEGYPAPYRFYLKVR